MSSINVYERIKVEFIDYKIEIDRKLDMQKEIPVLMTESVLDGMK